MIPIAATKLHPPTLGTALLERPQLVDLVGAEGRPLTVIVGPAGWGKSTLLAQWCASIPEQRVAFLAIDALDDEPVRYWSALIESVRVAGVTTSVTVPRSPGAAGPDLWQVVVPALVNDLAQLPEAVTLVLDDYQHITLDAIHEGMRYLIEHLPGGARLVLATREEPPLGLARSRASGAMSEIRVANLALDVTATAALVSEVAGVALDGDGLARLQQRTEGWPAGIQLAALSLRQEPDPDAFVARFAGAHRHVADYLTVEVFSRVPPAMSRFLQRCSVLDELEVDLCVAVTGNDDALELLGQAEEQGLFVVALDDERQSFRLHPLVAGWLRHRLAVDAPEEAAELHRRAAAWYERAGFIEAAGDHALAGKDPLLLRQLVVRHAAHLTADGRVQTLARWLAALPEEQVLADPVVALAAASSAATSGDVERAERLADAAATVVAETPGDEVAIDLEVELGVARAVTSLMRRDLIAAERYGRVAATAEADRTRERYGIGHVTWATALLWLDRPEPARDAVESVWSDLETVFVRALAAGVLATACLETGDPQRAERVAHHALEAIGRRHAGPSPEMVLSHLALGAALAARAELEAAEYELQLGIELSRVWRAAPQTAYGQLHLARLRSAQGRADEATALLRSAAPVVEAARARGLLARTLERTERMLRAARLHPSGMPAQDLTQRERDVLRLLPSELTQREIGRRLEISLDTVKTHTRNVYDKLGVASRAEAVARARELDLL